MKALILFIINIIKGALQRLKMALYGLLGINERASNKKIDLIYDLLRDKKIDFKIETDDIKLEIKRK